MCRAFSAHLIIGYYPDLTVGPTPCRPFGPFRFALPVQKAYGIMLTASPSRLQVDTPKASTVSCGKNRCGQLHPGEQKPGGASRQGWMTYFSRPYGTSFIRKRLSRHPVPGYYHSVPPGRNILPTQRGAPIRDATYSTRNAARPVRDAVKIARHEVPGFWPKSIIEVP